MILVVDLCGCCNASSGPAMLSFHRVRNLADVKAKFEIARQASSEKDYLDEIIGIVRSDRGFLLDLSTAGAIYVDARVIIEV